MERGLKGAKAVLVSRDPLPNEQRNGGHGDVMENTVKLLLSD